MITRLLAATCGVAALLGSLPVQAERLKEVASIQGVRTNQLLGYGLMVGLDGTGDQTTQAPFTAQSMKSLLQQLGIQLPAGVTPQLKNSAAVIVTAQLPAFSQPGQLIDVTVSSVGNAKSLRGGTLLLTPLRGVDGEIYAVAQGNVVVGGAGASAGGSKVQINHLSAGRIPGGATVERVVPNQTLEGDSIRVELNRTDFSDVRLVTDAINQKIRLRPGSDGRQAVAMDARVVQVPLPRDPAQRVGFLAELESMARKSVGDGVLDAGGEPARCLLGRADGGRAGVGHHGAPGRRSRDDAAEIGAAEGPGSGAELAGRDTAGPDCHSAGAAGGRQPEGRAGDHLIRLALLSR